MRRLLPIALSVLLALAATSGQAQPIVNGEFETDLSGWLAVFDAPYPAGTLGWSADSGGSARLLVSGSPASMGIMTLLQDTIFPGNFLWCKVTHSDLTGGTGFHLFLGGAPPYGQEIAASYPKGTYTHQITADRLYPPGTPVWVIMRAWPGNDTAHLWYITTNAPGIQDGELVSAPVEQPVRSIPTPFRGKTSIAFTVPREVEAVVRIHDGSGRLVKELARGRMPAGEQVQVWDGTDSDARPVPPGIYFCRVEVGSQTLVSRTVRLD